MPRMIIVGITRKNIGFETLNAVIERYNAATLPHLLTAITALIKVLTFVLCTSV